MKALLISITYLLYTNIVSGQNFEITHELGSSDVSGTTLHYTDLAAGTSLYTYVSILNHSGSSQEMSIRRLRVELPPESWSEIVWYGPVPDPNFESGHYSHSTLNPWNSASCHIPDNGIAKLGLQYNLGSEAGSGLYRYYVMNGQTVLDSVDVFLSMTLAVDPISHQTITMYPNPSENIVHFEGDQVMSIRVNDINGKVLIDAKSIQNNTLSVASLCDGIYQIVLETEGGIQTRNLVVRK
jgi:hypothetical protein